MARWLLQGLLVLGLVMALIGPGQAPPSVPPVSAAEPDDLPELSPETLWPGVQMPEPPAQVSVKLRQTAGFSRLAEVTADFGGQVLRSNDWTGIHTMHVPPGADPQAYADLLSLDPRVEWAEPVQWRRLTVSNLAPVTPNDTFYTNNQKWYYDVIKAPDAWSVNTGSPSVIVAVIDSGVMCTHTDLAVNMWVNSKEIPGNGIDDDGNDYVDDINGFDFVGAQNGGFLSSPPNDNDPCVRPGDPSVGNGIDDDFNGVTDNGVMHGTFVAGIIAASGNNGSGVTGMCWACRIMSLRVANPEGSVVSSDTAEAITYAARNGAKVINLSFGGNSVSRAEIDAIDFAITKFGATVVAAAGNENRSPLLFPARLPTVLSVGASGQSNVKGRASFSRWGLGIASDPSVSVVAPGVSLASTTVLSVADQNAGAGTAGTQAYIHSSGTSFSTPLVSGLAGLMLSVNPSLTPAQIRSMLTTTAEALPDDPSDTPNAGSTWAGAGMINAFAAVTAAGGSAATPTATPVGPTATPSATPVPGTPTATPTPLPSGAIPQPVAPPAGTLLSDLGTTVQWNLAIGTTQYQIQVIPANNDGPAINLIRDVDRTYTVTPPLFGAGPYVMLPGMTYSWRIRTTTAVTSIDENSTQWGAWSAAFSFRTRSASSSTLSAVAPASGVTVASLLPVLQWANSDPGVFYYEVQLSKDQTFDASPATGTAMVYWVLLHGAISTPPNAYAVPPTFPLESRTQYFWRVRPRIQGDGTPAAWSNTFQFSTP